jgi:hypothetical protein
VDQVEFEGFDFAEPAAGGGEVQAGAGAALDLEQPWLHRPATSSMGALS